MRLIGGNISDTPVKEIGDGSAFNVGAGASAKIASGVTSGTLISSWDKHWPYAGATTESGSQLADCALTSSKSIVVWRSIVDDKVKAAIIDFDSDGTPTEGAEVDLTAFTTAAKCPVQVYRISDSRAMIVSITIISTKQVVQMQVYDISGTSISVASGLSLQSITSTGTGYQWLARGVYVYIIDADRAVVKIMDYYHGTGGVNDARNWWSGVKFTATQNVSSLTSFNTGSPPDYQGGIFGAGSGTIAFGGKSGWATLDYDASSTPVLSNQTALGGDFWTPAGNSQNWSKTAADMNFWNLASVPSSPANPGEMLGLSDDNLMGVFYAVSWASGEVKGLGVPGTIAGFTAATTDMDFHFNLCSQDDLNHHFLVSKFVGANHYHIPGFYNPTSGQVVYSPEYKVTPTNCNYPTSYSGTVIVPEINPSKATCYGYQTAGTPGWYRYTIDLLDE
jgi:hypothetical protein